MHRVLIEQGIEDAAGGHAELVEEIRSAAAQVLGPFPAGAQGALEGEMAEEVQGVRLGGPGGLGQVGKPDADPFETFQRAR